MPGGNLVGCVPPAPLPEPQSGADTIPVDVAGVRVEASQVHGSSVNARLLEHLSDTGLLRSLSELERPARHDPESVVDAPRQIAPLAHNRHGYAGYAPASGESVRLRKGVLPRHSSTMSEPVSLACS